MCELKNQKHIVTIYDQENLHYLAEEAIHLIGFQAYRYDEEGNYIDISSLSQDARDAMLNGWVTDMKTNCLCFREHETLLNISFSDALEIPLNEIKEVYLKADLKQMRGLLRNGKIHPMLVISDDIPDEYLDDLLALRWREHLKLWTIQRNWRKREA